MISSTVIPRDILTAEAARALYILKRPGTFRLTDKLSPLLITNIKLLPFSVVLVNPLDKRELRFTMANRDSDKI